jgi:predicted TIM-barrel fold metal-dependent hydrolase
MSHADFPFLGLSRRGFLQTAAAAAVATTVHTAASHSAAADPTELIDTNVSLGQWPFRHGALADAPALVAKLREQGVTQAWAGSLDALLHKDISSVNARLAEECQQHGGGLLTPIGALNPMLPGWEEDLRRCVEVHRMPGIRLHPNYHGYKLGDPVFERVLQLAGERNLLVQISVIMEDERNIHPLVNVPATDTTSLTTVLKKFPKVRLQLLNAFRTLRGVQVVSLAADGVRFEIAMLEGVAGVEKLFEQVPLQSLCFGSYAPVFYFESSRLKLQESVLAGVQMKALCSENALRLLNHPRK